MNNLFYSLACLSFCIIIGGAVYEHLNVVPQWAAAPPASLSMFQGQYGLKAERFWMMIHPVTLVLMIITLILNWRTERRKHILYVLISYFSILVITAIYFVPELVSITTTAFSTNVDAGLAERAKKWEILSLVRLGALIGMAVYLIHGMAKERKKRVPNTGARIPNYNDAAMINA